MAGTTLRGVSLYTRSKAKDHDVFDLAVTPEGIEILRRGQDVRLLAWDRVATWEIEERKRHLLLILRGDGSVTPLLVPGWTMDDLDQLLRAMTAHLARPVEPPAEAPDLALPAVAPAPAEVAAEPDLALPAVAAAEIAAEFGPPDLALPAVAVAPPEIAPEIDRPDPGPPDQTAAGPMDLSLPSRPAVGGPDPLPPMDLSLPPTAPGPDSGPSPSPSPAPSPAPAVGVEVEVEFEVDGSPEE